MQAPSPHIMPVFRLAIHFGTISFGPGQPTLQSWLRAQRARQLLHFYNTAQRSYTFEYAPQPTSSPRLSDKFAPPTPYVPRAYPGPRERDIYCLIASGRYICYIWEIYMFISPRSRAARSRLSQGSACQAERFRATFKEKTFGAIFPTLLPPFGANVPI